MIGKQLHLRRIADLAAGRRLPSFCSVREFAEAGGLLSYGYGPLDDYRHAAALVKKNTRRRSTRRPAVRATDKARSGDQPHDREFARLDDAAIAAVARTT